MRPIIFEVKELEKLGLMSPYPQPRHGMEPYRERGVGAILQTPHNRFGIRRTVKIR